MYSFDTFLPFSPKIQLEEYLIFDDTLPSALLEEFACKEVLGQKGLPPWGRGLSPTSEER